MAISRVLTGDFESICCVDPVTDFYLEFNNSSGGTPTPYVLQTIRTRESDDHHIVIGVRRQPEA